MCCLQRSGEATGTHWTEDIDSCELPCKGWNWNSALSIATSALSHKANTRAPSCFRRTLFLMFVCICTCVWIHMHRKLQLHVILRKMIYLLGVSISHWLEFHQVRLDFLASESQGSSQTVVTTTHCDNCQSYVGSGHSTQIVLTRQAILLTHPTSQQDVFLK